MKIVFDTSVLLSAFLSTEGLSAYVLRKSLRKSHAVIISPYILKEARDKLSKKLGVPRDALNHFLVFLKKNMEIMDPAPSAKISFSDEKDIPILELVQFCQAHYLVTWDKELLDLRKFGHALVLNPKEIMGIL